MSKARVLAVLFGLVVAVGCGGDDGGDGGSNVDGGSSLDGGGGDGGASGNLTCDTNFGEATACGGDLTGTWDVAAACDDFDYTSLIEGQCANATQTSASYDDVSGELVADATSFAYTVSGSVTIEANLPSECVVGNCTGTETAIELVADSATCEDDGSAGCDCTMEFSAASSSSGDYTAADGLATVDDGSEWYFCVDGDQLLLRENKSEEDEPNPTFLLDAQ